MIYFDNAATTYPKPEIVYTTLIEAQRNNAFNAGRGHYSEADNAQKIIDTTRDFLCELANSEELVFTPSATHAINQIISGLVYDEHDVIYCSPYEHNAVVRTLYFYKEKYGFSLKLIPLKKDKTIDLEKFKYQCINDKPKAIFCTHISNVTGYILPIRKIGEIAETFDSLFVVDGAQAFGLLNVDIKLDNIDYYVFAGHKSLYGPFGIAGFFTNKNDLGLSIFGGTGSDSLNIQMPMSGSLRYEPSSPNIVAISGLLAGAKWINEIDLYNHEYELQRYTINKLKNIDGLLLYHVLDESVGIISFNLKGYTSESVAKILSDEYHICVRAGYHCCPFIHDILDSKEFLGTVRISFGYFNTKDEIDCLIDALNDLSME